MNIGQTITCAECALSFVYASDGGISTNAAIRQDGARVCLPCAAEGERAQLRKREPMLAYISCDGKNITDWKGNKLADARRIGSVMLTRQSYTHGRTMSSYSVTDIYGNAWHTRGSAGIACTLRPCKTPRRAMPIRQS